ncbi:MAG: hypothetical protein J7556_20980 [Acidovorax sp.]|nr:hypothetical protein [Acidovorax sp.]
MPTTAPAADTPATKAPAAAKPAKAAPRKQATKPAVKATAKTAPAKAAKPAATAPAKEAKAKKPKLVRDSFTIPKDEYAAIETLKLRTGQLAHTAKKSELLRAGLKLLAGLSDAALLQALQAVPSIKTGRPKAQAEEPAPAQPAAKGKNGRK